MTRPSILLPTKKIKNSYVTYMPLSCCITCSCDVLNVHMSLLPHFHKSSNTYKFQTCCFAYIILTVAKCFLNYEFVLYICPCLTHRGSTISITFLQVANLDKVGFFFYWYRYWQIVLSVIKFTNSVFINLKMFIGNQIFGTSVS